MNASVTLRQRPTGTLFFRRDGQPSALPLTAIYGLMTMDADIPCERLYVCEFRKIRHELKLHVYAGMSDAPKCHGQVPDLFEPSEIAAASHWRTSSASDGAGMIYLRDAGLNAPEPGKRHYIVISVIRHHHPDLFPNELAMDFTQGIATTAFDVGGTAGLQPQQVMKLRPLFLNADGVRCVLPATVGPKTRAVFEVLHRVGVKLKDERTEAEQDEIDQIRKDPDHSYLLKNYEANGDRDFQAFARARSAQLRITDRLITGDEHQALEREAAKIVMELLAGEA